VGTDAAADFDDRAEEFSRGGGAEAEVMASMPTAIATTRAAASARLDLVVTAPLCRAA
jgi:hypothetical protein